MFGKMYRRAYELLFDRVETEFSIDPARIDWIRRHEPHKLRPVSGATPRNAWRVLQFGLLAIAWSLWRMVRGIWLPGDTDPQLWFTAGLLLGAGGVTVGVSRLLAYLAYLKGEVVNGENDDPPRREREEAPAC